MCHVEDADCAGEYSSAASFVPCVVAASHFSRLSLGAKIGLIHLMVPMDGFFGFSLSPISVEANLSGLRAVIVLSKALRELS